MYRLYLYQHKNFQSCAFSFCQGKLVKLFSRQLVAKQKCNEDWNHNEKLRYYPKLEQWLQVVGINEEAIKVHVCYFMCTLHVVFHFNKRNSLNLLHLHVPQKATVYIYVLFSPLHPQLNTTVSQDFCICLTFYLFVSCLYKAIPGKMVCVDDAYMIVNATQQKDGEFETFLSGRLTWKKIMV